jgi:pimeloyl-ACP methyl ester carboxylesterase
VRPAAVSARVGVPTDVPDEPVSPPPGGQTARMDPSSDPVLRLAGHGLTLAADAYGPADGPPVVMFHGGGQTRHAWGGTARLLGDKGWRATTVDLRGHGDSEWAGRANGGYSIDAFAADVRAVAAAQPRPPVLIGASLGGLSSLVAIAEAPAGTNVASGLVLVDVAPRLEEKGIERIAEFMLGNLDGFADLDEVADAVAAYNPHRPRPKDLSGLRKNVRLRDDGRWYWHWDPAFVSADNADETRSVRNEDRLDDAARAVTVPTLLVRGRQSDVLSEEGVRHTLRLMPQARYVDVGGAGHMVAGDRNDAFNDAVVEFLRQELPAG